MIVVSFDLETWPFRQHGCMAPRMVCATFAYGKPGEEVVELYGGDEAGRKKALDTIRELLEGAAAGQVTLSAQNGYYDYGVLCAEDYSFHQLIYDGFDRGTLRDTMTTQMLIDNARGELKYIEDEAGDLRANDFSLQALVKRHLKKWMQKGVDSWQRRYHELEGVPTDRWPEDAKTYPMKDALYTLQVDNAQQWDIGSDGLPGTVNIHQHAWGLYLQTLWGLRTDAEAVERLDKLLEQDLAEVRGRLISNKLVRANGVRDMKAISDRVVAVYQSQGKKVKLTETKRVSTERDVLVSSGDKLLQDVSEMVRLGKVKTTYVPALRLGSKYPINCRYNAVLETLRASASKPNIMNPPRKGGVRECFVPRNTPGVLDTGFLKKHFPRWVYVGADYDTAELRSLAEVCYTLFGYSHMGEALRADRDIHLDFAADELIKAPYEHVLALYQAGDSHVDEMRQLAKVADFGLPGGMAGPSFQEYARKSYGLDLTAEQAKQLHRGFRRKWKEMEDYFSYCNKLCSGPDNIANQIKFIKSGMLRGKVRYTAVCNGFFQHLTAMGAKDAVYEVSRECYLGVTRDGKPSPLAGCRPVLFLHDELILEVPEVSAEFVHLAALRLVEVMKKAMMRWIERVPVKASPVVTRRWYKGAKAVYQNGLIVPVKPEKTAEGKTKWVPDLAPTQALAA